MPSLTWPTKRTPDEILPGHLTRDSIVFPGGQGYPGAEPQNRLIFGDNLPVMGALLPEYEGKVKLVYADPPFFTNREYPARIGRGEDSRRPEGWALAEGYRDSWRSLDEYLGFLYERLVLIHRLLAEDGTFYLHLDWHANSYARLLLDEIFGADHLLNEIVWTYHGPSPIRTAFNRKHDTILAYTKSNKYTFNADAVREPYNPATVLTFKASPKAGFGKVPNLDRGKVPEDWWYFPVVARLHNERTGYPTQKPEGLLERIIRASSNPGELVADFFCGSGTTPACAARLGRKFLAADGSFRAVHTTRRRLCALGAAEFTIERESGSCFPLVSGARVKLERRDDSVKLLGKPRIDYWEIDPSWDGVTFRSAAQAQRGVRSPEMEHELRIKTGRRVCVRLVTIEGGMIERELGV